VVAAALSTTGPGARAALPDDAAVRALLPRLPDAVPVDPPGVSAPGSRAQDRP